MPRARLPVQRLPPARPRSFALWLVASVAAAGATLVAGPRSARAYVRTRTADTGVPFFWTYAMPSLEVARPAVETGIAPDALWRAARAATWAWSTPAIDCTRVALELSPGIVDSQVAAYDGHDRIVMRTGEWCRDPVALTNCHDPSQLALTTVFSRSHPGVADDGQILEADIEINAVDFRWAIIPDGTVSARDFTGEYDLASVLTHETGHFIGLAHDCLLPGDPPRVDDVGNPSPACDDLPPDQAATIQNATMYPLMSPVDISVRSLSPDDTRAACEIYPVGGQAIEGGCAVAARPGGPLAATTLGAWLIGAAAAILIALRVRRRGLQPARRARDHRR